MANRYPYPHPQVRPGMAPSIPTGFPSVNMWHHQPQSQSLTNSHQLQLTEEKRQREYFKQQQKLRLMAATNNKQPVNADKLIENLLETKDTFRPRNSHQNAPSLIANAQVPIRQTVPTQNSYMVTGGIRPINYSQSYPHHSSHHTSASTSSALEVSGRSQKKTSQENSGIGFQLPTWLSSQSPSLPPLYHHVWTLVGVDKGLVDTSKIFPVLLTSGLPTDVLGYIWGLANQKIAGQLTEDELYIVLALVGLAQSGCTFNNLSILNLIPQAPVPSLNLSSFQLPTQRNDLPVSSHEIVSVEEKVSDISGLRENAMPLNMLQQIDEATDDFSDFQSASCSNDSAPVLVPEPDPDPERELELAPSHDSPIHIKDPASTPSVAFQGVSPASDGHKFPSIFSLGSSSRCVGSRLANHSLGAPKQTKNRHHKHHHHHHHHHHQRSAQQTASTTSQTSEQVGKNPVATSSPEEDDFSDFQQAKEPVPVCSSNTNDLFPKCPAKTHNKQYMLKESAIRSDNTENKLFFDSPVHIKVKPTSREISTTANSHIALKASDSDLKILPKPDLSSVPLQTSDHELLSVEEDKYSALRALSLAEKEAPGTKEIVSDDFGDFLSAEPASTEDSFAALASRDVPKSGERILESKYFWPSSGETSQTVEFQLDDWCAFESKPEITSGNSNINSSLLSTGTTDSSVSGLVSALQGLDLQTSGLDFSWNIGNQARNTEAGKDSGRLEANTASPAPSATASDNWLETNDDFSQSQSKCKGYGLTFLGKIYDDHNQLISNTKNDLFVLENEQHADSGPFVIKTQDDDDDEFGEFIGPEAWPDDSKFAVKEAVFEGQAVLRIKDSMCDTQSVSSLELPVLSRHGSLPSLDLKIFPGGSDKSGLLHSWDCSPQGIDLQIKEWCRCLQSCLQLLQAGLATFTTISNESIVEEVVTSREGKEYLLNLLEVYGICRRLKQSSTLITSDPKLDSILAEVDIVWTSMESYFTKAELKVAEIDFGCSVPDPNQEHSTCGICLTSVGSEVVQDSASNVYPLEYGGHVYHAACANLWVNCVDCRLPGLATTGSLL